MLLSFNAASLRATVLVLVTDDRPDPTASLAAIATQGESPLEVLLVDGRSSLSEELPKSLERWTRPGRPVVPLRPVVARGINPAAAVNQALELAQGEAIAIVWAGDRWVGTEHLALALTQLRRDARLEGVATGWQDETPSGQVLPEAAPWHLVPQLDLAGWLRWRPVCTSGLVVRRSALVRLGGWDEAWPVAAELDWLARFALGGGRATWLRKTTVRRQATGAATPEAAMAEARAWQAWSEAWFAQPGLSEVARKLEDPCRYHLEVWLAWRLYCAGAYAAMAAALQRSLTHTPYLRPETIGAWVAAFADFAAAATPPGQASVFDPEDLLARPEWQRLVALALPLEPCQRAYLQAQTRERGLDQVADTVVLYRILGNDLPPRHKVGQTLENLAFILTHEPPLPNCQKRWVVNRIVDRDQEAAILDLLHQHQQEFLHLPFVEAEYQTCEFEFGEFLEPNFLHLPKLGKYPYVKTLAIDHTYRHKNCYVMNNNGSRNAALAEGKTLAKWVAPFDGNCFFTAESWEEVYQSLVEFGEYKYFTVDLVRVDDNAVLLQPGFTPTRREEPQLIFRCDAAETFAESLRYGRFPKVELLKRLRIAGEWDEWNYFAWERRPHGESPEAHQVRSAGWVARLASGAPLSELGGDDSRRDDRHSGGWQLIDRLDEAIARRQFQRDRPLWYSPEAIAATAPDSPLGRALATAAEAVCQQPLPLLGDKPAGSGSGDRRHFWHAGDGAHSDRHRWGDLCQQVTILALAQTILGGNYGLAAADRLRLWFLDPQRGMLPNLDWARGKSQAGWGQEASETLHLYFLLDAVRLLEASGEWAGGDRAGLVRWLESLQHWLVYSETGQAARARLDWHGPAWELQTLAIAAYLDDLSTAYKNAHRAKLHLIHQVQPNGRLANDLDPPFHHRYATIQVWLALAKLAAGVGVDLGGDRWRKGDSLGAAVARELIPGGGDASLVKQSGNGELIIDHSPDNSPFFRGAGSLDDEARLAPLVAQALALYPDQPWPLPAATAPQVFASALATPPFWRLVLPPQPPKP